jgi:hypothetical protein
MFEIESVGEGFGEWKSTRGIRSCDFPSILFINHFCKTVSCLGSQCTGCVGTKRILNCDRDILETMFTLEQAMKAQTGSRGIAILFH